MAQEMMKCCHCEAQIVGALLLDLVHAGQRWKFHTPYDTQEGVNAPHSIDIKRLAMTPLEIKCLCLSPKLFS